ncbi:TNF receptor-associated factor 6-like [Ornithodoros turicata]|uniref:TNF receptor-associated factor 6-like n=1 Tax=Ornithodoros turicata TaxID=34597 RepID=UPI003139F30B
MSSTHSQIQQHPFAGNDTNMQAQQSLQKRYIIGFEHVGLTDWTEVEFASPIPRFTSCLVCGSIASEMLWGRCWHVFCHLCASITSQDGVLNCPLDGVQTREDALHRDNVATEVLLAFRVYCPNRTQGCDYIGPMEKLKDHTRICGFYNIQCQMCGYYLKRFQLREHAARICPVPEGTESLRQVQKNVAKQGHQLYPEVPRESRSDQQADDMTPSAPASRMAVIFNGNSKTYDILNMVNTMKDMCREYEDLKNSLNIMREDVFASVTQLKLDVDGIQGKIKSENEGWKDALLADMKVLKDMLPNRVYEWRVWPYSKLKKNVLSKKGLIKSEAFYIGHQGYHMAVSGSLGPDPSSGAPSFLAYIHIRKGIFDPMLEWPYKKLTTLKLVNNNENGTDKIVTVDPKAVCADELDSFERPRSDMNVGYGFSLVTMNELERLDKGYLRDDAFTVKISVELP